MIEHKAIRRRISDALDLEELAPGVRYPQPHGIGDADAWAVGYTLLLMADMLERERARCGERWWLSMADAVERELARFAAWLDGEGF